jgi:hypothetical protein
MATTDLDGTNLLLLGEGGRIALVLGEKSYRGTLQMRKEGIQEEWYIKLDAVAPGEPDEIAIHRRTGAITVTDAQPPQEGKE